ncbi:MAG: hypothetical protein JRH06_13620 [Deltaproteobacteria bacterium]|nr:hypothetical protein [Deltaproteobacteria bacterium]
MFYSISLYASLLIFAAGMLYKMSSWFWRDMGVYRGRFGTSARIKAAARGIFKTLFSKKVATLIWVFLVDVIIQRRVLRENFLRWLMHILIFAGFMLLLIFHALDNFVSEKIFPDYMPTLNPAMFLRDLFGVLAVIGIAIAIYRRLTMKVPRLKSNPMDIYAVGILAVVMLPGRAEDNILWEIPGNDRGVLRYGRRGGTQGPGGLMGQGIWSGLPQAQAAL